MNELPFTYIIPGIDSSELVWVEGGIFKMGSSMNKSEKPIHKVNISSFAFGKYPVTQELWMAVMGNNPSYFIGDKRPVDRVSWGEIQEFFQKINQDKRLLYDQGFRLPSEAEWEYAARGGLNSRRYRYAGGEKLDEVGWYLENSNYETKEVGLKLPNSLNLYDLSGNVWEWCEDQFHKDYKHALDDGSALLGMENDSWRSQRGGSWDSISDSCRPCARGANSPSRRFSNTGFRVLLGLFQGKQADLNIRT